MEIEAWVVNGNGLNKQVFDVQSVNIEVLNVIKTLCNCTCLLNGKMCNI